MSLSRGILGKLVASCPVVNTVAGTVPFAVTFDQTGHLVVGEAGPSRARDLLISIKTHLTPIDTLASGQTGLCWVTTDGLLLFTGNTAANFATSGYPTSTSGQLSLLGATHTDPGTVDGSASSNGQFPLCPDRREWDRRRVSSQHQRNPDRDRLRDGRRRSGRPRHCRNVISPRATRRGYRGRSNRQLGRVSDAVIHDDVLEERLINGP